jgi:OOP family OmpA-OmpF porin
MKKINIILLCFSFLFFGSTIQTNAQDAASKDSLENPALFSGTKVFRTWSIGINAGMLAPFSAAGGKNDFSKWLPQLGYGAYVKYQASHTIGIQLDFLRGTLKGNNDNLWAGAPPVSDLASFKTDVNWATSISTVFTLGNINWSKLHTAIQPYISVGIGGINFDPTTTSKTGVVAKLKPSGSFTEMYVPLGIGFKANLSKSINLDLGYTMAYVDADNLDGYYKTPYLGDKFSYAHAGLEFSLGNSKKPQLATHNAPAALNAKLKAKDDALQAEIYANEQKRLKMMADNEALRNEMNRMKMDSDGDGVSDYFDKCPNTAVGVKVDGGGCPLPEIKIIKDTVINNNTYIITAEDKGLAASAMSNLEFDFGKYTIRSRSFVYLDRLAELLVKKHFGLKLSGHTDAIGSEAANLKLSENRANSVKDYLVSKGADASHIEAIGFGESQPLAPNKTAKGRQMNRRVAFALY